MLPLAAAGSRCHTRARAPAGTTDYQLPCPTSRCPSRPRSRRARRAGARGGLAAGAAAALAREEVYAEDDGRLHLYPWYPHEDPELAGPAAARAAALGVALPPRHLDAPYECCWYLARCGPRFLARFGDPSPLTSVPGWADPGAPTVPGVLYQRLEAAAQAIARELPYRDDPDWRATAARALSDAVAAYLRARTDPDPALLLLDDDLQAPLAPPEDDAPDDPLRLVDVRLVGDGLLLGFVGGLVHTDLAGAVRRIWPATVALEHVGRDGLALTSCAYGHWHVLDLERGWVTDRSLASLLAEGALDGIVPSLAWPHGVSSDPDEWDRAKWLVYTPDHQAYAAAFREREPGVFRAVDHAPLPSAVGPTWDGDGDDEDADADDDAAEVPVLLAGDDAASTVLYGVRFTTLAPGATRWVDDDGPARLGALVQRGEGFRAYRRGRVLDEGSERLRFGVPTFCGGFDRAGERLVVAGRRHLHLVALDPPQLLQTIALGPLRRALEAARG
ncbi:MAG: hypothetical protein R3F59_21755 [Myxococcota bacterium]